MIRNYTENDITNITELGNILHKNYEFKLDVFSKCLVYTIEDKFIGFIIYSIMYERAEIVDIIINTDYRNRGYGKKLINNALNDIKKNNCKNVTLEVSVDNEMAIKFYVGFGFKIVKLIKNYYLNIKSGTNKDAYLMELKF